METEAEIGVCTQESRKMRVLGLPQSLEMAEKSFSLAPSEGAWAL